MYVYTVSKWCWLLHGNITIICSSVGYHIYIIYLKSLKINRYEFEKLDWHSESVTSTSSYTLYIFYQQMNGFEIFIDDWLIHWLIYYSVFIDSKGHVALDRNPGPGYNTLLLWIIPWDLLVHVSIDSSTHYLAF